MTDVFYVCGDTFRLVLWADKLAFPWRVSGEGREVQNKPQEACMVRFCFLLEVHIELQLCIWYEVIKMAHVLSANQQGTKRAEV